MKRKILLVLSLCLLFINEVKARNYMPYPVVFVHGFASDADTWKTSHSGLVKYFSDKFDYETKTTFVNSQFFRFVDYSNDNKANGVLNEIPLDKLRQQIDGPITAEDPFGGVLTQLQHDFGTNAPDKVILVCHSMGGLVTRALLKKDETPKFTGSTTSMLDKPLGYYRGCIDKIIFIGTPHRGSPFASASWLIATKENAEINFEIASVESEIFNETDYGRKIALSFLRDNLRKVQASNTEIINFAYSYLDVDMYGASIEQMRVPENVTDKLSVTGEFGSILEQREIITSYSADTTFLVDYNNITANIAANISRVIYSTSKPIPLPTPFNNYDIPNLNLVELLELEDAPVLPLPITYGVLNDADRQFTFPDNSQNTLENLRNEQGDGVVTTDSQLGVYFSSCTKINAFHTNETDEFEPILKFLDEQKPAIVITDSAGGLLPDNCVTNNPDLNIKIIKCTERTGFCGIQKIILYKDTVNSVPYDSNTLNGELEYVYKLKDEIYHSPWEPILPNGRYYIKAIDMAGNESEVRTFTIDTAPPSVAITEPSNNYTYNLNIINPGISIKWNASDNIKLDKVVITLNGPQGRTKTEEISLSTPTYNWSTSFSFESNEIGSWIAKATAYDLTGNRNSTNDINFNVVISTYDNGTGSGAGGDGGSGTTNPYNRDTDGDGLNDALEQQLGTDPNKADTDGGGLNDGAEIAQGKNPFDPSDDDKEPYIKITNPHNGDIFNTDTVGVSGEADSQSSAKIKKITVNGKDFEITPAPELEFSGEVEVGEGSNVRITATSIDEDGNSHTASVYIKVDKTPPSVYVYPSGNVVGRIQFITIFIKNGVEVGRTVTYEDRKVVFSGQWYDSISGIDISGVNFTGPAAAQEITESYAKGSAILELGQHTVSATITDKAGNIASKNSLFNVIEETIINTVFIPEEPDDNESVSYLPLKTENTITETSGSGIVVLANGFAPYIKELITNTTSAEYILIREIGELTVERYPILVIPSGGLNGVSNSNTFKQKLVDYVNSGGTIICFTQQHGYDFAILPGNISGYGYQEDQLCQSNSVYINEISPIFNGQTRPNLDCNVDGYFVSYPTTTKVLLNRTKNNMPCMIEYDISAMAGLSDSGIVQGGKVIVTTLYSDFSYAQGSLSSEERTLIHSLITYAKDPTTEATQSLMLAQPVEGITYSVQAPSQLLLEGQDATFTLIINNTTSEDKTFNIVAEMVHISKDEVGTYTIPANTQVEIPFTLTNIRSLYFNGNTVWHLYVRMYDLGGGLVGTCEIGGTVIKPYCEVNIQTEQKQYYQNDTVNFGITLNNTAFGTYFGEMTTKVLDSNNNNIYQVTANYDFSASTSIANNYSFTLPSNAVEGPYIIVCEANRGIDTEDVVAAGSTYFEVPKTKIAIPVTLPTTFVPNATNTVTYNITNSEGDKTANGNITINLKNPDNTIIYTETKSFSITPNTNTPIQFNIPIGDIQFGNYKLEATATYDGTTVTATNILPSNATVTANFNKTQYAIRENLGMNVTVYGGGKFQQSNLKLITQISALDYTDEETIAELLPGQSVQYNYTIPIPETVGAGSYSAIVRLMGPPAGGGGSEIQKIYNFTVLPAKLGIVKAGDSLPANGLVAGGEGLGISYTAGQTANIQIQNTGGVDGQWDYVLRLYNDEELPIYEKQGTTLVLTAGERGEGLGIGENYQEIFFELSNQLKNGSYRIELNGIETTTGKLAFDYKRFMISGLEASVTVNTNKEIYKTNENINISAMAGLSDSGIVQGGLVDAKAAVKVYSAAPGWENIMHDKMIYNIAKDPDNKTIWFATDGGLICFDTTTLKMEKYTTAEGLPCNDLRAVAVDENDIYIAGEDPTRHMNRFLFARYNKITRQSEILLYFGGNQQIMLINTANAVWIKDDYETYSGNLRKYDKTTKIVKIYGACDGICYDGQDLWVSSTGHIHRYNTVTDSFNTISTVPKAYLEMVAEGQYIWAYANVISYGGTSDRYTDIYRYNKNTGISELVKQDLHLGNGCYERPGRMAIDYGRIYICNAYGDRGLVWYDTVTGTDGDFHNVINSILDVCADTNNLWVGTYTGIYRYEKNYQWQNYSQLEGLSDNSACGITLNDKYIWVELYNYDPYYNNRTSTIEKFDRKTNQWLGRVRMPYNNKVYSMYPHTSNEELWLGTDQGLYILYNTSNTLSKAYLPEDLIVYDIKKDVEGIWLACDSKIFKYQQVNNQWQTYNVPTGYNIMKLQTDGRYIWAAGGYANGEFSNIYRYDREENSWATIMSNIRGVDIYVDKPDEMAKWLKEKGIGTRRIYPSIHTQEAYNVSVHCPNAELAAKRGLWLPSSVQLKDEQIDRVTENIGEFFEQNFI